MFKKLEQKLQSMAAEIKKYDPSGFGDPIAMQTEWTSSMGGPSADKLVKVSSARLEFRASLTGKLVFLFFTLTGLGMLIAFTVYKLSHGGLSFDNDTIVPLLIGLAFTLAGSLMLYSITAPAVFDKRSGFFWKGRKAPDEVSDRRTIKYCAKLEDIHALQLISFFCSGPKMRPHYRYELNLVLKDAKRVYIVLDDKKDKVREDARTLSQFLDKPVWDAI